MWGILDVQTGLASNGIYSGLTVLQTKTGSANGHEIEKSNFLYFC